VSRAYKASFLVATPIDSPEICARTDQHTYELPAWSSRAFVSGSNPAYCAI
jgi:hypothetical protein